jgi:hypothetical protein
LFAVTDLDELAQRFEAAEIPKAEWTHEAHLRVGAVFVQRLGPAQALDRLRTGIRRLNEANGVDNSTTGGYHETITACYVRFIDQFLSSCPREMTFDRRVDELLRSSVARREFLFGFFSRDLLMSQQARAQWVEPDLMPLPG